MPRHDPVPPHLARAANAWASYKRLMKWMALVAIAASLLALLYIKQDGGPMPIHMVIATFAGVAVTILLGTALMGLVFLSNNSGHDDSANPRNDQQ